MSKIDNLLADSMDDRIRLALKDAEHKGKLGIVAAVTGIAGGTEELKKILTSTESLSIMDRGMLGLYLWSGNE